MKSWEHFFFGLIFERFGKIVLGGACDFWNACLVLLLLQIETFKYTYILFSGSYACKKMLLLTKSMGGNETWVWQIWYINYILKIICNS